MNKGGVILLGLAIGATAAAIYQRRTLMQALTAPRSGAALPPGQRSPALLEGAAMQNVSTMALGTIRNLSMTLQQQGPSGLVGQGRRYLDSARKQLDIAIAEGQLAAAQTRRELEERFAAAKKDPGSARSAFS